MGCCCSRLDSHEAVSRCKARRRYMKHLVQGRQAFAAAHSVYLLSLRSTGAALLQFANAETHLQLLHHHLPPLHSPSKSPPPPPPPIAGPLHPRPQSQMSSISDTWTTSSAASQVPPPPPPPQASSWDFWDPFMPSSSSRSVGEEWEEVTTTASEVTAAPAMGPPPSVVSGYSKESGSELAMVVVPKGTKNLSEIVKELDNYFLKAAESGNRVSKMLEAPNCDFSTNQGLTGKICSYGKNLKPLHWSLGSYYSKPFGFTRFEKAGEEMMGPGNNGGIGIGMSHSSTVGKLYAWEKKLYVEVKNAERSRQDHEKRVSLLRKQEAKGVDYVKMEKNKMEIEKLETKMMVASQAIETTTSEIIKLRESELFPQLLELVTGLMGMWRSMYECHQVQTHIVQQLEYLNGALSTNPTTNIHRQAALQLEMIVERWYSAFCNLVTSQRDYIYALTGWLRLSLFQCYHEQPLNKMQLNSNIYSLCEEWQLALDRIPDKVASEGIKSFLSVIHAVVVQQTEEQKQKKKSEAAFKEFEKKAEELRSLESKYGSYTVGEGYNENAQRIPILEKKAKVEASKARAEEEKSKYEKSVGVTRAMTLNNLQTGFPNIFQAMTGFASVCMQAFESVYNHQRIAGQVIDSKSLTT